MREKTVYTDGKRVTVTGYSLRVGKRLYPLEDISRFGISRIVPARFPSVALMGLGAAIAALEFFKTIPYYVYYWVPAFTVYDYKVSQSELLTGTGVLLFSIGFLSLIVVPVRYGVRINSHVGDMNVVVSRRKKYVERIVDAIGEGLRRNRNETRTEEEEHARTVKKEIV
jgi:hypothetical protein